MKPTITPGMIAVYALEGLEHEEANAFPFVEDRVALNKLELDGVTVIVTATQYPMNAIDDAPDPVETRRFRITVDEIDETAELESQLCPDETLYEIWKGDCSAALTILGSPNEELFKREGMVVVHTFAALTSDDASRYFNGFMRYERTYRPEPQ